MTSQRKFLAQEALSTALKVRKDKVKNIIDPVCIFDLAEDLGVEVRFAAISSLEGMYSHAPRPAIVIGAERPAGRRVYTCGHELGHHAFGHGTRIDELRPEGAETPPFDPEEFLAQTFAGFLLMPKLAVCNAFTIRGWKPSEASAEQVYRLANLFGVTYTALVHHMTGVLGLLPRPDADILLTVKLNDIRARFISDPRRQLVFVDTFWTGRAIDLEVGDLVLVPNNIHCDGASLKLFNQSPNGIIFEALQSGRARLYDRNSDWASYVRVSRHFYEGRNIYRHLEEVPDE